MSNLSSGTRGGTNPLADYQHEPHLFQGPRVSGLCVYTLGPWMPTPSPWDEIGSLFSWADSLSLQGDSVSWGNDGQERQEWNDLKLFQYVLCVPVLRSARWAPNSTSHYPTERTEIPFVSYHKPHYHYIRERMTAETCLFTFVHPRVPAAEFGRKMSCLLAEGHDQVERETLLVRGWEERIAGAWSVGWWRKWVLYTSRGVGLGWEHGCFIHSYTVGKEEFKDISVRKQKNVELEPCRSSLLIVSIFSMQQEIKSSA